MLICISGSGKLAIFGVDERGRMGTRPSLSAHSDGITDFMFSPFYHDKFFTASEDRTVSVYISHFSFSILC